VVTTLTLASSENPSQVGDAVSFTATLPSAATGNVVFLTNGVPFSTNTPAAGQAVSPATTLLPAGSNLVAVTYAGDANYLAASNAIYQVVTNPPPPPPVATTLTLSSSENPSAFKAAVSFTATLPSAATGNVVFLTNGVPFSTNTPAAGQSVSPATTLLPAGSNLVTVTYAGDAGHLAATTSIYQVVTNLPPVAAPMIITRIAGTTVLIALSNLATNWSDPYGYPVSLIGVSLTSTNGQHVYQLNLTTNRDGSYVITNTAYLGYLNPANVNDQISYTVSDGHGDTNEGVINLVVSTSPLFGQTRGIVHPGGPTVTLNFAGQPGYTYDVQRSTNLITWVTIWTTNAPPAGPFKYTDAFGDLGGQIPAAAYYRLTWNP
jgi:hypothetical protein